MDVRIRARRGEWGRAGSRGGETRFTRQSSHYYQTDSELILGRLDLDLVVCDRPGAELGLRRGVGAPRAPAVEREPASGSQLSAGMSLSNLATPSSPKRICDRCLSSSPSTARLGPVWPPRGAGTRPRRHPPRVSCSPTRACARASRLPGGTAAAARTCASRTRPRSPRRPSIEPRATARSCRRRRRRRPDRSGPRR